MANHQVGNAPGVTVSPARHSLFPAGQIVPFILVTALFFLWGIPNNLNDVLIRHFMKSFEISRFQAGLVQSAFYLGYFLLAIPAGLMMKRAGYKTGFVVGLLLLAGGAVRKLRFLSVRALCHRQRALLPGDGFQPFYCPTRRSRQFGAPSEFLAGVQSSGLYYRGADRHDIYLFRH